jgi:hypothetical protein
MTTGGAPSESGAASKPAQNQNQAQGQKKGSPLLPATFEQRGCYVPFTTPVLAYARLRRPQATPLEVLIPGLAGGSETYVIPHKVLPEIINLTVHDRALHEELTHMRDITPIRMRQMAARVALTGLGGPGLARRAKQDQKAEQEQPQQILLALISAAVAQLAPKHPGAGDLDAKTIATPDGMKLAREALGGYAQSIGERGDKIYARLEQWSKRIAPIGAPDGSVAGYLATQLAAVEQMALDLSRWLVQEPPETAEMAQRSVTAARAAAGRARDHLRQLDAMAESMAEPLRDFETADKKLAHHVLRMALMLDGWLRVSDLWNEAKAGDRFLQRDTVEAFAQYLPILPQEAVGENAAMWTDLRQSQTRWSRNSQHRIDSNLDQDTKEKLTKFRKEPV